MSSLHFRHALLPSGWARDVRIALREDGCIAAVDCPVAPEPGDARHPVGIPGLANLHSHAFQRAMAGLGEQVPTQAGDDFWGWRDSMYRLVTRMTPQRLAAVAALAYLEMLESGFTHVAEFHYLHHDAGGAPYADPACMAAALLEASGLAGIGITLLPVHYAHSDFGGAPPLEAQRRFVTDPHDYARLRERTRELAAGCPGALTGTAVHSLRAVTPAGLSAVLADAGEGPVHIHVAEQVREVEACLAWSGARPVEWLLENAPVDPRWCLVHATHVETREVAALAASGAVAGLCPVTEANLGDGVFPAVDYLRAGGRFGVGSDSNVSIGVAGELALLEYGQRLTRRRRNCLGAAAVPAPPGRALVEAAAAGGAAACGIDAGAIREGARADLVALDTDHPAMAAVEGDGWLDAWVFAAGTAAVSHVWVRGRQVVSAGAHPRATAVRETFRATVKELA